MASGALWNRARFALMPGFDLCTRRRVSLSRYWRTGPRRVLDAGFGNGWFSFLAYRSGAVVTAISNEPVQVAKAKAFYNGWLNVADTELEFRLGDLRALDTLTDPPFDEIICYETLEHIPDDRAVCRQFHRLLAPHGQLHLCVPNSAHPRWAHEPLDASGTWGGHVRAGYTHDSLNRLLRPLGFEPVATTGVGGRPLAFADRCLHEVRGRVGDLGAAPLALPLLPFVSLGSDSPRRPYSVFGCFRRSPTTE